MSASHTAGDWRVSADGLEVTVSPVGMLTTSERICRIESAFKPVQQVRRNATLIAASPVLLSSLIRLVRRCERELVDPDDVDELHAAVNAIAKALGA